MGRTTEIPVNPPLKGPNNQVINMITLREPTTFEALEIGEPYNIGEAPGGTRLLVENREAIVEYVKRCLVNANVDIIDQQGGIKLARQIKQAMLDFFQADAAEVAG